ncbi:hypothetical protein AcetOrient_orf03881 [Acetobacter orientalis]|uniref:Uncharacterized protein n=1 Tax=Acetobacter orientalis TaxID=146474 RepID=A0A2Z5ZJI7_9PROT|nr:hypothetical protein AcetOrient_orf03881 [Acetobacter orientalis]
MSLLRRVPAKPPVVYSRNKRIERGATQHVRSMPLKGGGMP